ASWEGDDGLSVTKAGLRLETVADRHCDDVRKSHERNWRRSYGQPSLAKAANKADTILIKADASLNAINESPNVKSRRSLPFEFGDLTLGFLVATCMRQACLE